MDFNALIARVKNILLSPKSEWPLIAAETQTMEQIYKNYVGPLALFAAICTFFGSLMHLSSFQLGNIAIKTSTASLMTSAVFGFFLSLLMAFVMGHVISFLAPKFGGSENVLNGFKLAVYSYTASWVGMVFMLLPGVGLLASLCGLYGIYLLYLGLPTMMKNPEDKSVIYTVAIVACGFVLGLIAAGLTSVFR
jgi:hypothetical protein